LIPVPAKPHIEKLSRAHDVTAFDCGVGTLNVFLRQYALQNQKKDGSQTWLALTGETIAGYYTLAVGEVAFDVSPDALRKGLSRHPVPVMILARLAVDRTCQGRGIGQGMLKDALLRTLNAAEIAGIRAMLVHAKDASAQSFYTHFGFAPFPESPLTLYRLLKDVREMAEGLPRV
jgi:GNAT superfamily N-acetyltransferase